MRQNMLRDVYLMVGFSALRTISDLFLGTFFVSFIMHITTNDILSISFYKFFEYLATVIGYYVFSNVCKRFDKKYVFFLNILSKIAIFLLIMFLGDRVVDYIIPFGMICGTCSAMYHLPMHLMIRDKVAPQSMSRYIGMKNAIGHITKILAPVILGLFITVGSYTEMAYALLGLSVLEFIMFLFLSPTRHHNRQPIDFRGFFCCMRRFPVMRSFFLTEVLRGFSVGGILGTVITMYTVYMFHTDLKLGAFTTIFAICSILTTYLAGRFAIRRNFPKILMVCTILAMSSMAMFVFWTTTVTFLIYNFIYATVLTLMLQIDDVNVYNLAQSRCVKSCHQTEYFVLHDTALFIGRWASLIILMYIGMFGSAENLRWYLMLSTIAVMISGVLSMYLSRHIRVRAN